jgi:toxin ParE1/3/4
MSYAIRILKPAEADAVEAALWYDTQVSGLGAQFLEEVNDTAQRLTLNPQIHSVRFADVRRAPVPRFKFYGLYYLIRGEEVWILAVHHGRRHPRWIRERREKI